MKHEFIGIVNLTPDSFSGDGIYFDVAEAERQAHEHFAAGASMIDVGAESTRPGAEPIDYEEEWRRLHPVLRAVALDNPSLISVDTYHPETVYRIAETIGSVTINDVTGTNNKQMRRAIVDTGMPVIISHLDKRLGTDIQRGHKEKPTDKLIRIVDDLQHRVQNLVNKGYDVRNITLDGGFGFGKKLEVQRQLLYLPELMPEQKLWLLGVSRKSSLRLKDLAGEPLADFDSMSDEERNAWLDARSVEVALEGAQHGYTSFRVHNVGAHVAAFASRFEDSTDSESRSDADD